MRKLATTESRLLVLFGAAVFLALNLFVAKAWLQQRKAVLAQITSARGEVAEGRSWIEVAETLQSAQRWMKKNPPQANTGEHASAELLQLVRTSTEANGLKIVEETLLPASEAMAGQAAALEFNVSGPFPGVAKLLFALQSPAAWRAVDKLVVRSETEPPNVLVDIKIRQYYQAPTNSPSVPPGS